MVIMLWRWIGHLLLLCFHDGCKYQNLTFLGLAAPFFSFGPPVAFVFLLCVLPVRQPEQDEASFRVRHDSRLDRFQLIIYRPGEKKKDAYQAF